ncbi:MAG: sulfotransferase family protein [Thermoplasmatota archaeon]
MSDAARPNFFLIGAPKSGTSAMCAYLRQHPEVFLPRLKEPYWFSSDLLNPPRVHSEKEYLGLFAPGAGRPRIGEGSVGYLYSEAATRNVHAFDPEAKLIVMLRDPVSMVPSYHSQLLYECWEPLVDLEEALDAEDDRRQGKRLPKGIDFRTLAYSEVADYAPHIERWQETFGKDALLVLLMDDLKADAAGTYRRVLEHLGVDPGHEPDLKVVNPAKDVRYRRLHRFVTRPPYWLHWGRQTLPITTRRGRVLQRVKRWNARPAQKKPMPDHLRARLAEIYGPKVRDLERVIGRDLSHWAQADR